MIGPTPPMTQGIIPHMIATTEEGITIVMLHAACHPGGGGAQGGATHPVSHPDQGGQGGATLLVSPRGGGVTGGVTLLAFPLIGGGQGLTGAHLSGTFLRRATPGAEAGARA